MKFARRFFLLALFVALAGGSLAACDSNDAGSEPPPTEEPPPEDDPPEDDPPEDDPPEDDPPEDDPPEDGGGSSVLTGTVTFTPTAYTGARQGVYNLDLGQGRAVLAFSAAQASRNAAGQYGLVQSCGSSSDGVQVAFADAQGVVTDLATACVDKTVDYRYPKISPDGAYIAFRDYRGRPEVSYDLVGTTVVANREGEEVAVFPELVEPAWTPDGHLLLSGEGSSRVSFGLYLTDANLENPERISGDQLQAFVSTPDVHPGGERVAFAYNSGLWQMNLDGTGFESLYRYEYALAYPVWSPNGDWLAFVDTELIYGPRAIFLLDLASGEVGQAEIPLEGSDHPLGPLSWVE